jgi:hypothetical protein
MKYILATQSLTLIGVNRTSSKATKHLTTEIRLQQK